MLLTQIQKTLAMFDNLACAARSDNCICCCRRNCSVVLFLQTLVIIKIVQTLDHASKSLLPSRLLDAQQQAHCADNANTEACTNIAEQQGCPSRSILTCLELHW